MPSPDSCEPAISIEVQTTVPAGITVENVSSLVSYILECEQADGAWQFAIRFVDDTTMQAAHAEFMGIDEPTDIMTFPYDVDADEGFGDPDIADGPVEPAGADLIISVDRAADSASDAGWSVEDELFFLIAHGLLHVLGWDDALDDDRAAMLERQSTLISGWRGRA